VLGFGRDAFAWHARTALARLGHPRAAREILRDLGSRDASRRVLGVVAAGQARLEAARPVLARLAGPGGAERDLASRALGALDRAAAATARDEGADR
jgi:hypothetical protein